MTDQDVEIMDGVGSDVEKERLYQVHLDYLYGIDLKDRHIIVKALCGPDAVSKVFMQLSRKEMNSLTSVAWKEVEYL